MGVAIAAHGRTSSCTFRNVARKKKISRLRWVPPLRHRCVELYKNLPDSSLTDYVALSMSPQESPRRNTIVFNVNYV